MTFVRQGAPDLSGAKQFGIDQSSGVDQTLPANWLMQTGDYIDIKGSFDGASSGTSTVTLLFGSNTGTLQTILNSGVLSLTASALIEFRCRIKRTGASAGQAEVVLWGLDVNTKTLRTTIALSANWASTQVFRHTLAGTGIGLNRIQYDYMQQ
jgi:hypothetical protein